VLDPILERIHLQTFGSPRFYLDVADRLGMTVVAVEDQTPNLVLHYSRVLEETERRYDELQASISREYLDRMKAGLARWIDGGRRGYLAWAVFCFRKR
jgi:sarcosine/dimethylglycine N-methyltransferase